MNHVIQSLMKKRNTPKKQMCSKHSIKLVTVFRPSPAGQPRRTPGGKLAQKKVCPECEKETNKA